MFDNIKLKNCPDKFALNCKRYEIKCHECKANEKGKYLLYLPINKSIKNHPANNKPKINKTSYSRKGKKDEQKTIDSSEVLQRTAASGSYVGDGDAFIPLGSLGKVRVEHKTRYNNKNLLGPTTKELKEGLNQNIKVWYIKDGTKSHSIKIFVNYNFFSDIIKTIFTSLELKVKVDNQSLNSFFIIPKGKYISPTLFSFELTSINRGLGLNKKDSKKINFYTCVIARTSYGKFCYLSSDLFEKLITIYQELI